MATISVTEFASTLDTTPREARKFLRTVESLDAPGKGGRWAIEKRAVRSLTKQFEAFKASQNAPEVPNDDADDVEYSLEGDND